ncbi:UTP--glucose-1-phosphate uridylyltransferase [Candidatus Woesebacteria bacterium]|nr:UTP--glucose-1-phosphate uridylyltransferase [Candidatus Woesebacteria bacterium]
MKKITKAVIPAAGFGTRFLPQTKAMPKEMLPIVDKPVIQYVVEEAVEAGIEDIVIVTGWNKRSIEDHFDYPYELIMRLQESGKEKQVEVVKSVAEMANFIYIRQKGPLGNATPIWNARNIIGDEPFMVLFGDDFIISKPKSRARQLIEAYEKYGASVLSSMRKPTPEDSKRYGYVAGQEVDPGVYKVSDIIEKPGPDNMPSDMAIISGYIFTPEIFDCIDHMIKNQMVGHGGEYIYTDALNLLRAQGQDVYAKEIENAKYYDTGNKLEYMKTIVELAMGHEEIGEDFKNYLETIETK